jgi:hypothetical protein
MKLTTTLLVVFALILQGLTSSSMAMNSTLACHENSQVSMSTAKQLLTHMGHASTSDETGAGTCNCHDNEAFIADSMPSSQQSTVQAISPCEPSDKHNCDKCSHCDQWHSAPCALMPIGFTFDKLAMEFIPIPLLNFTSVMLIDQSPPP